LLLLRFRFAAGFRAGRVAKTPGATDVEEALDLSTSRFRAQLAAKPLRLSNVRRESLAVGPLALRFGRPLPRPAHLAARRLGCVVRLIESLIRDRHQGVEGQLRVLRLGLSSHLPTRTGRDERRVLTW
jgi:hypothetical protein